MRIQVIINSRSRVSARHLQATLLEMCADSIVRVAWTERAGHATVLARDAVRRGFGTIVAVGGDGTINEILNGIIGAPITLGIIPAGTANDLASYYGIPRRVADACAIIAGGHVRQADIIRVNGWYFLTAGGIGFPCRTLAISRALRRGRTLGRGIAALAGKRLYVLSSLIALLQGRESSDHVRIHSSDGTRIIDVFSLIIGNQPVLGERFRIAPGAVNNDGQLDICVIENGNGATRQLRIVLDTMRGRHLALPEVRLFRADRLLIESPRPLAFFGDGEITLCDTRFDVRVVPGAVRILAPCTTEGS